MDVVRVGSKIVEVDGHPQMLIEEIVKQATEAAKKSLTTEQLGQSALETVEQMSPAEKAKLRQQLRQELDKSVPLTDGKRPN